MYPESGMAAVRIAKNLTVSSKRLRRKTTLQTHHIEEWRFLLINRNRLRR